MIVKKSPVESRTKQGDFSGTFVPLGRTNDEDAFHRGGKGASIMIALLLVFVTDQADVDTKDEINQEVDIIYPVINYND